MFDNNNLTKEKAKREVLSQETKEQLDGLYLMLEERYGQGFADEIMKPFTSWRDKSRH